VSAIIWIVMALGALVLFGMIGYRLPGQIRARRAELAAADSELDTDPDTPTDSDPETDPTTHEPAPADGPAAGDPAVERS
jgi:hypothetical protein